MDLEEWNRRAKYMKALNYIRNTVSYNILMPVFIQCVINKKCDLPDIVFQLKEHCAPWAALEKLPKDMITPAKRRR